jgi:hypothetical protein
VDDDFIRNLKETLTRRAEANDEQVKKENREAALIGAKAPDDWKMLKGWLKESITQLPLGLVDYEEKLDSAEIRYRIPHGMRTTHVVFRCLDKVMTQVVAEAKGGAIDEQLIFECGVQGQSLTWGYPSNPNTRFEVPEMGKAILTAATRG